MKYIQTYTVVELTHLHITEDWTVILGERLQEEENMENYSQLRGLRS